MSTTVVGLYEIPKAHEPDTRDLVDKIPYSCVLRPFKGHFELAVSYDDVSRDSTGKLDLKTSEHAYHVHCQLKELEQQRTVLSVSSTLFSFFEIARMARQLDVVVIGFTQIDDITFGVRVQGKPSACERLQSEFTRIGATDSATEVGGWVSRAATSHLTPYEEK